MLLLWSCNSGHRHETHHEQEMHAAEAAHGHGEEDPHDHGALHGHEKTGAAGHSDEIVIAPEKAEAAGITAEKIELISGILNGTTNYILTKMFEEGMDFDEALAQATELGYAEADPTADVEGLDAGRKIAILASIAFHSRIGFSDVYTEGITRITARDIAYARELGCVIKLLGIARNTPEGIETAVYPMLLPQHHPLASVRDSFNAIFVHGDAVDDAMFYGRGAGQLPTASAVMGDVSMW